MKKRLCVLLAIVIIAINLVACGKEEQQDVIIIPPELLQEAPPAVIPETLPAEIEPTMESENTPNSDASIAIKVPGTPIEIIPSDKPAAEGEFGTSADFTGIYEIRGCARLRFNGEYYFNLTLNGIDNNNGGDFDASVTSIPDYILEYRDYIYLNLVFDNSGLVSWSVIDKLGSLDVGQPTVEQLEKLTPDVRYEKVAAGVLPGTIFLSDYEVDKMYVFDLPADAPDFILPEIVNDSDEAVLIVSTKVGTERDFKDELRCNLYIRPTSFGWGWKSADEADEKYYLFIRKRSIELALAEVDYLNLSTCTKGELIDFNFEDFLYNDTDKVFTISYGEDTCVINPGQLVDCSWVNEVMVVNIE